MSSLADLPDPTRDPELAEVLALLEAMPRDPEPDPSDALEARVVAAVREAAGHEPSAAPVPDGLAARRARRVPRRLLAVAASVALLVAGAGAGIGLTRDDGAPAGPVEVAGTLRGDGASATITVRKLGYGRTVALDSTTLPVLPAGQYYELWFVGPRDRPDRPQRISGGTFHPDERGVSKVTLKAAADPRLYPGVVVSREPGDGNPAPSGDDVLRLRG